MQKCLPQGKTLFRGACRTGPRDAGKTASLLRANCANSSGKIMTFATRDEMDPLQKSPPPQSSLVLVTGSSGRLGRAAVRELQARGHAVRGFDRVPTPGLGDCIVGDLTDADALRRA